MKRGVLCCLIFCELVTAVCHAGDVAENLRIASVTRLNTNGGRVDWEKVGGQFIAYDKRSPYNYYNTFLMTTNGTDVASLTAGNPSLPGKHVGNPAWYPNGQYLVVEAERANYTNDGIATPGQGYGNDLWFITSNGVSAWKMENVTIGGYPQTAGVLHPHFSNAGKLLDWAEYTGTNNAWLLKLADFTISNNAPVVSNVRSYNPSGRQSYYETHTFSPDDSSFLYMSDTDPYLNIYSFNIATATAKRLSSGSTTWNEHAHYSPDGTTILWMSSTGLTPTTNGNYPTEYWAMNPDTTDQRQLSWFNTPGHQQYLQHLPVVSGDEDWNAAGNQFVGYVQVGLGTSNEMDYDVLVTFAPTNAEVASLPASAQFIYPAPVPSETNSAGYEPVELYAADTGGVTITRLTFSQFTHIHAAVSPDRLKIVSAVVLADTDGNGMLDAGDVKQLWVFDPASGTQHAIVTNYDAGFGGVDWSVDSQNIYCSMTQTYTNYDIYRINPTGSSVTPITTNLLTELGLAGDRKKISDTSVSPDGLWLAYSFAPPQGTTNFVAKNQIGICHLDGTSAQLVTDGGSLSAQQLGSQNVGDFGPSLAPGDQFVVFERVTTNGLVNNNPSGDIYSEQIATSKLTAISPTNQLVVSAYPDWSLDQRIVYTESNPSLERIGPVLARTNGTLIDRLNFAIDGSNFKWIAPAWPQSTLTLTGSASGQGILSWLASTNFNYQIQTTVNLYSNWVNLGSLYYGSNLTVTQAVNLYPATNRFYRLNIGVNAQTIDP